jgi:hypothetical protein
MIEPHQRGKGNGQIGELTILLSFILRKGKRDFRKSTFNGCRKAKTLGYPNDASGRRIPAQVEANSNAEGGAFDATRVVLFAQGRATKQ